MSERASSFGTGDSNNEGIASHWKYKLFLLQETAPKPKAIHCSRTVASRPDHYGSEFHGLLSREATETLLNQGGEGSYLVRESSRGVAEFTLCFVFDGHVRNYKLYFDQNQRQHYVGEKRFDSIEDLVADGLITLFMEKNAADYIRRMADETVYEESPYSQWYKQTQGRRKRTPKAPLTPVIGSANGSPLNHSLNRQSSHHSDLSLAGSSGDSEQTPKSHSFRMHTFRGANWCDLCGNFLWGLVQQGVKCEDCGYGAHRKCSEKVQQDCVPDLKYVKRLFGVDLTTLTMAHKTQIPAVVDMCINEVELRGLKTEGIYRVPGYHEDIETLRVTFDSKGTADLSKTRVEDINSVACLLKLYFRLLPLPLIPYSSCKEMTEALTRVKGQADRLKILRNHINNLPPAHYYTLRRLMFHLRVVADKKGVNKMSEENLAVIFFPTVMRSAHNLQSFSSLPQEQYIVNALITAPGKIFAKA